MGREKPTQESEESQEKPPNITEVLETMRDDQRQLDKKITELSSRLLTIKQKDGEA
jgi:hypothetical protein